MLLQIWDFSAYSHRAECCLPANVGVLGGEKILDFGKKISRHFYGSDVSESAKCKTNDVLIVVVEVAGKSSVSGQC